MIGAEVRPAADTTTLRPTTRHGAVASRARRLRLGPVATFGLAVIIGAALVAIFAGVIAPGDPLRAVGPPLQPPSAQFPLGTDDLGRDMRVLVIHGTRTSFLVGLAVATLSGVLGTVIGSVSGFFGRWVDDLLMRFTELVQVVPRFFLVLVAAALFGPSIVTTVLLLGLTFWPGVARMLRAQVLSIRERDYVLAARTLGSLEVHVMWRHVLPNALPVALAAASLQVGTAILVEAGLSFLGLGDRTLLSWGYLLNSAQPFLRAAWWMSVFPGLAIALLVLAVNVLADGLDAAWNPRLARRAA